MTDPNLPAGTPPRSRWRYLLWGVQVAVLLTGALALGIYLYVLSQVSIGTGEEAPRRPQARAFGFPLRLVDRVNILLIGIDVTMDNRRRVLNVARADTLVLATFDPDESRMAALSIPRDTRAEIAGVGTAKINASYAYGGPRLTVRTVEQLLGVRVDFYVKLGAESFAHIIDAVGGVEVDVEKEMKYTDTWAGFAVDLKPGRQRLTGQQAAGYIRFRHDALGDIGRVERQMKVALALAQELRRPSTVLAGPRLLRAFAENTESNLTPAELATLGLFALRTDAPLRVHTLPGTFAPLYWEPDTATVRTLVADLFYGVSEDDLARVPIEVLNASGVPGLARQVAGRLEVMGFRTVRTGTAAATADATTVIDRAGRPRVARMVAATVGSAPVRLEPAVPGGAVTVVVARDAVGKLSGTFHRRSGL